MSLSIKDPAETLNITFDHSAFYTSVTSPVVTISLRDSLVDIPSMKVIGPTIINNNQVIIPIQGGVSNTQYDVRCTAVTNTGETVVVKDVLTVKTL